VVNNIKRKTRNLLLVDHVFFNFSKVIEVYMMTAKLKTPLTVLIRYRK